MKNLNKLVNECKTELDNIGIEYGNISKVTVNTRAKKRWGQCCMEGNGKYSINISERILQDDILDKKTKNTIIHELLHTCKGCMNHGENWKRMANKVNRAYPQYNITRCTSCEEMGIKTEEMLRSNDYKYTVKCCNCGKEFHRMRKCELIQHPEFYRCNCGGELKRIK